MNVKQPARKGHPVYTTTTIGMVCRDEDGTTIAADDEHHDERYEDGGELFPLVAAIAYADWFSKAELVPSPLNTSSRHPALPRSVVDYLVHLFGRESGADVTARRKRRAGRSRKPVTS